MPTSERIELLLQYATELTDGVPIKDWPIEDLDGMAFEIIREGTTTTIFNGKYYEMNETKIGSTMATRTGMTAITGFFRGFEPVAYLEEIDENTKVEIQEPTLRLDKANQTIFLMPISHINSVEVMEIDYFELLGNDDETLQAIAECIRNQEINLKVLAKIFGELKVEDIHTQIYLNYLNETVRLSEIFSAIKVKQIMFIDDNKSETVSFNEPELVTLDGGRTFSLIGGELDDGSRVSILCVSTVDSDGNYMRAPVQGIQSVFLKQN
jgi:hypothetical protein